MKKYLLFVGSYYYPERGLGDLIGDFDTIEEASIAFNKIPLDSLPSNAWAEIWDSTTKTVAWKINPNKFANV